jgi:hypothetical protein
VQLLVRDRTAVAQELAPGIEPREGRSQASELRRVGRPHEVDPQRKPAVAQPRHGLCHGALVLVHVDDRDVQEPERGGGAQRLERALGPRRVAEALVEPVRDHPRPATGSDAAEDDLPGDLRQEDQAVGAPEGPRLRQAEHAEPEPFTREPVARRLVGFEGQQVLRDRHDRGEGVRSGPARLEQQVAGCARAAGKLDRMPAQPRREPALELRLGSRIEPGAGGEPVEQTGGSPDDDPLDAVRGGIGGAEQAHEVGDAAAGADVEAVDPDDHPSPRSASKRAGGL